MKSNIESVAVQLDEVRKARLVKSQDIDVDKYLKNNDVGQKVRIVSDWLDEITENYINPPINDNAKMPWTKTQDDFNFRLGEVTLYAGGNGGGKSLITGQIALHLIKQKRKCVIASFEMKPTSTIHRMLRQFAGEFIDDPLTNDREKYIKGLTQRFNQFAGEHLAATALYNLSLAYLLRYVLASYELAASNLMTYFYPALSIVKLARLHNDVFLPQKTHSSSKSTFVIKVHRSTTPSFNKLLAALMVIKSVHFLSFTVTLLLAHQISIR